MKFDRKKNGIRNIAWGIINQLVIVVFPFIIRTVLIKSLGAEYLGLNSLYTSILTVLNMAELGFSNAIIFNMYKPIAENDRETICALLNYYKRIYRIIGIIVAALGMLVMPFLPQIINGTYPQDINIYFLYFLFLVNTFVSYFLFSYRAALITAFQREDVISKVNIILKILLYVAQVCMIVLLKSYYLYVVLMIINTVLNNLITAYCSYRMFPEFRCVGTITKQKKTEIGKNIEGLMVGKLCIVSRNTFDSIFLSIFLGLETVAVYSNYYYIMNSVNSLIIILMTSIGAAIGNSIAKESQEKNYHDMQILVFIYAWIAGWCTTCLVGLYQPFMRIWVGEDMMFPYSCVCLIALYFYSLSIGQVRSQYASSAGLFWQNRIYVIVETISNIIL